MSQAVSQVSWVELSIEEDREPSKKGIKCRAGKGSFGPISKAGMPRAQSKTAGVCWEEKKQNGPEEEENPGSYHFFRTLIP